MIGGCGGAKRMMKARLGITGWMVAAVLLGMAASGCAPKRVGGPGVATASRPRPVAASPAPAPAPGKAPAGDQAAAAGFDPGFAEIGSESEAGGEPAGPPVPADQPEPSLAGDPDAGPGDKVAELARTQVGKPYGWGATGPERFDCSGLAMYVYRQLGIALPRVSLEQAGTGVHVERSELKPGDLVFFSLRSAFDHVGIFLGNNRFVHAPRRQEPVRVDNLDDAWWNRAYRGARRVFGGEP